jgi:hypothetical protein
MCSYLVGEVLSVTAVADPGDVFLLLNCTDTTVWDVVGLKTASSQSGNGNDIIIRDLIPYNYTS